MNYEEIINWALLTFGQSSQKMMAMEECAELINVLAKEKRGRTCNQEVITEIADVMIMTQQLAVIYGKDAVEEEMNRKLSRLEERIRGVIHSV